MSPDCVIENLDLDTLYEVPLALEEEGLAKVVCKRLGLEDRKPDLESWTSMVNVVKDLMDGGKEEVTISLVGKYVSLHDAYISIVESLKHGGIQNYANVNINWVDSEEVTAKNADKLLKNSDGILVPGGFGDRGVEGKMCVRIKLRISAYVLVCRLRLLSTRETYSDLKTHIRLN